MIRGVAFDLDDTLYPEREYVLSGFTAVAAGVARSPQEQADLERWLREAFESGVRGDTFDRLRARFPDVGGRVLTSELIERYRNHRPVIALDDAVVPVFERLAAGGIRLGIITDGPASSQAAKVAALGLPRWCAPIVLTDQLGPGRGKPDPAGFEAVAAVWALPPHELAYVGDNPRKDFIGPRRLGWHTIRLRRIGRSHAAAEPASMLEAPDVEVDDLRDVPRILGRQ